MSNTLKFMISIAVYQTITGTICALALVKLVWGWPS